MNSSFHEPAQEIPVAYEADLCVLGGSCTGVFAAIRAARLGLRVALVEKQGCFGGVATASLVCVWHSLFDTEGKQTIIDGLTRETMDRLETRGVVQRAKPTDPSRGFTFNPEELKITLDEMVLEAGIKPYLHTQFCAPLWENGSPSSGRLAGVAIENKSGRSAIKASFFIDATGDGDLAARAGCDTYFSSHSQPATTCATISGWDTVKLESHYSDLIALHGEEFDIPNGFAWGGIIPGSRNYMMAATRIYGTNPANADDLTQTEIEGRRQVRAILDLIKRYSPESQLALAALPSKVGLRSLSISIDR
jgi:flavin-dependent dehydrogenase